MIGSEKSKSYLYKQWWSCAWTSIREKKNDCHYHHHHHRRANKLRHRYLPLFTFGFCALALWSFYFISYLCLFQELNPNIKGIINEFCVCTNSSPRFTFFFFLFFLLCRGISTFLYVSSVMVVNSSIEREKGGKKTSNIYNSPFHSRSLY
jgi:hypothetical protein